MAVFVEADAFISPSPSYGNTLSTGVGSLGYAKMPLTTAGRHASDVRVVIKNGLSNDSQTTMAPWSSTALEMSGGGGESEDTVHSEGTATIPDEIFNLVKSIVGAGVLSLPAGTYLRLISLTSMFSINVVVRALV